MAGGNSLHTIDTQPSKCGCTDVNALLIADAPLLLEEVKRLREKLFEAELWVMNDSYTFENDMKELNDYAEAMEE